MTRNLARLEVVIAFIEDLSKVTLLRIAMFLLDSYLTLASRYSRSMHWYRDLTDVLTHRIWNAVRSADLRLSTALAIWFGASLLLIAIYRVLAELLGVGPRSLLRRGFVLPRTGLFMILLRNLPGVWLLCPPPLYSPPAPLPLRRSSLPLLAVFLLSWVFNEVVVFARS